MNDTSELLAHIALKFNIQHPSFEECYAFGYECALAEIHEDANPFDAQTKEAEQWTEGWWDGFYGEKPIYELKDYSPNHAIHFTAANEQVFTERAHHMLVKLLEIGGVLSLAAFLSYYVIDMVA